MTEEKIRDLVEAVDPDKRELVKRMLMGGAALYSAPLISTFSLGENFIGGSEAFAAANQTFYCHPVGSKNKGKEGKYKETDHSPDHGTHHDAEYLDEPGTVEKGDPCDPETGFPV